MEDILLWGKVLHSQRIGQSPLVAWIISEQEGTILSAHCNCTAGLSEGCAHVGATLFAIEDAVRNHEPVSVTEKKAYWIPLSHEVGAQSALQNIDFKSGKRKYEEVEIAAASLAIKADHIPEPSNEEQHEFLRKLSRLSSASAILNVVQPYCDSTAQRLKAKEEPYLIGLYNTKYEQLHLEELQGIAQEITIEVSNEECVQIDQQTNRDKATWFGYRRGRVTASLFKRICCTKVEKPSISLIKQVCYPESYSFSSVATRYGCTHENQALKAYEHMLIQEHDNFTIRKCGLIIHQEYPFFGATPDALISCSCHGDGCVEVKCPYCIKDVNISEIRCLKKLCLQKEGLTLKLDRNHSYFYQIQMQMAITKRNYCDFVVWTSKSMFLERIAFDTDFWQNKSNIAINFHKKVILPELLSKIFTKSAAQKGDNEDGNMWCICRKSDDGMPMIACDNDSCNILWYHTECLKLMEIPTSPWYCPGCSNNI